MAEIRILEDHIAELIAAGEVVERPASVVKELLENSIDAGATQITLSIEQGGIKKIEISDNGSGIERKYIRNAFIRHATSKISNEKDLDAIHTLGFRGEALASIAAVSKVHVLTCTSEDIFASHYYIEGGTERFLEEDAGALGTTITVSDLFYNTPARMKFLKKDSSEAAFVGEIVSRIALSHPEISFTYIRDGKRQFKTPGDSSLRSTAYSVLGKSFAQNLIEIRQNEGIYRVNGLITPPAECRASRGMQYFFVNKRYIKNKTMMAALENAFKGSLMQGRFPGCVLFLEMPCDLVDVNVHPAKTEVRFARESDVYSSVYQAVKSVLLLPAFGEKQFNFVEKKHSENSVESVVTENSKIISIENSNNDSNREIEILREKWEGDYKKTFNSDPIDSNINRNISPASTYVAKEEDNSLLFKSSVLPLQKRKDDYTYREANLDILPELEEKAANKSIPLVEPTHELLPKDTEQLSFCNESGKETSLTYIGEVFKTYIIAQRNHDELIFLDKHAAHERLIYENIAENYGNVPCQMLLAPVQVNLSASEKIALLENESLLQKAGIEIDDFGDRTVLLRSVPADIEIQDPESMVIEIADKLSKGAKDAYSEHTEWVLHSISCRAAMKAGDRNYQDALFSLAEKVLSGKIPPFCPHGRPIILKMNKKELEKQFGRLG